MNLPFEPHLRLHSLGSDSSVDTKSKNRVSPTAVLQFRGTSISSRCILALKGAAWGGPSTWKPPFVCIQTNREKLRDNILGWDDSGLPVTMTWIWLQNEWMDEHCFKHISFKPTFAIACYSFQGSISWKLMVTLRSSRSLLYFCWELKN